MKSSLIKKTIKQALHRSANLLVNLTSPMWARLFRYITRTGSGTDICIRYGFLPMPIHFHSPVPDIADLQQRQVWRKKSELAGIDFQAEGQVHLLRELGEKYGNECDWPALPTNNPLDFYTENNSFSFGCAASLHGMIRNCRPVKIIEIGSGNSSLVISSAVTRNQAEGKACDYIIIDPYPAAVTGNGLLGLTKVIPERVELLDTSLFKELQENDILFIDSGHTVRTGGDVNFLILDILPRLAPGVIVHFHDIGLPYDYPEVYFTRPDFRVFWTEAYLLQAFLCCNPQFELLLAMNYLMKDCLDEFRKAFPYYDPGKHRAVSSSFWMRRIEAD